MDARNRIAQLLTMAWGTNSTARISAIAGQILELDPDNPEALMLKADNTDNAAVRAKILTHALDSLNTSQTFNPDDRDILYLVLNQRMAFTKFSDNQLDEALKFCTISLKFAEEHPELEDTEGGDGMKSLYYRILLEHHNWQAVLAQTMRDEEHGLAWAYSRLIAAYMLAPEQGRSLCASMFWDALMLGPDVPFYMLGYFGEPEDSNDTRAMSDFDFAVMYYDVLSVSDDFFNWFSRGVVLFGLLSGRFTEKERDYMIDVLDNLGGYYEYEKMSVLIKEGDDESVIEMLAANRCLSE